MNNEVYASVDLGGTNLRAALGTAEGTVLCADSRPTLSYEGPQCVLEDLDGLRHVRRDAR